MTVQPFRISRSFALLLAGVVAISASGPGNAQDTSDAAVTSDAADQVDAETSRTADDSTARNANQSCLNRFGSDLVRAFNRDRNDEPVNADNIDLTLTPQAEPVNVPC